MKKLAYVYFCLLLVTLAVASKSCSRCCLNGRDGIDGVNGRNGANGADGKDGKNGKNGIDGINGKNGRSGIQGIKGKDGKDGKDGKNGVDGKNGINGMNGKNGVNGVDGKDGQSAVKNWKQCAWKRGDGRDNGIIKTCSFKKKHANTHLQIIVSSNMRIYNCDGCCKRWFITINGKECQDPVPIDAVVYLRKGKGTHDLHRPRAVIGVCKISTTGVLNIAFNVGNCPGYGNADAHTGWNSSSHMYIEELDPPQA